MKSSNQVPDCQAQFGKSDKPPGPYTTRMMAGDTIALMDLLGIEKAHIVAGSLGGMIAQEMAIDHPERVDKVVSFCTSAGGQMLWDRLFDLIEASDPGWNRSSSDVKDADLRKFMAAMLSLSFNSTLYQVLFAPVRLLCRLGWMKTPVGQLQAMMSHNTLERLDRIQAPTLVLAGGKDRLMPPQSSAVLASGMKGARLVVVEGGGHALAAGPLNKEVLAFLSGD